MEEKKNISKHQMTTIKGLDFVVVGTISLIFFLCPLFFTGLVAQNVGFEKMILFYFLVLLGTVVWVTKGVITGELNFKRTPLDLPIVGVLIIFIISTILSVSQKDSLIGSYGNSAKSLAAVIVFCLFYYLVVNNIDSKRIKLLYWSFTSSTIFVVIYSILQLFSIYILPMAFTRATNFNPLGSISALTQYLVIMLPLLIVGMSQLREIHPNLNNKALIVLLKIILGLTALFSLFVLTLLNGFTFWPIAIVGVVIVLMFFLSKVIKITSSNLVIPIAAFLLLIILFVLGNFNIVNLNLPAEVSLSRGASWDIAKSNIANDPIFGSGPSTFYYSFSKFKSLDFNNSALWNVRFDSASGLIFEILANEGILGALALVVLTLITLSICFLSLIKLNKEENQSILLALFSSFICVIIFSLMFTLNNSIILILMLVSTLAIAVAVVIYPEKFKTVNLSFRASAKYALALAAIFLSVSAGVVILFTMGIKMFLADFYAKQSLVESDMAKKNERLIKAIQLAPYQDVYYINLANNYMSLANQEAVGARDQATIENNLSLSIEQGRKALDIAPNNANNEEAVALIYENASFYVRGALEWAENLYNKVIELDPGSPTPYVRIALINMARSNAETDKAEQEHYVNEAIKKYDEAIAKKADFGAAYYGKAVAYERLNDINNAIEQLKKAVISARDNIDYRFELGRMYFNRGVAQPNIEQNASEDITKGEGEGEDLSVQPDQATGAIISKNDDLKLAEQAFLSIVQAVPNHANALYSLALLYQKVGETDNAKIVIKSLMNILQDESTKDVVRKQFPGLY